MTGTDVRTVLAFDYGSKRIGAAVGQTVSRTATELSTIAASSGEPDWSCLNRIVDEWAPDLFVVGVPDRANPDHPLRPAIERFARRLTGRFHKPVEYVEEHLSSIAAAAGPHTRAAGVDAAAARVILETWLEDARPRPDRTPEC
jgi:putative Holliday junction resolvase